MENNSKCIHVAGTSAKISMHKSAIFCYVEFICPLYLTGSSSARAPKTSVKVGWVDVSDKMATTNRNKHTS